MAKHHNPRVITSNLLLNLDFRNPKRFSTNLGTNLVQDQNYNASTWGVYYTNKTTGIDAPDGSKTAVRMSSVVRSGTYTLTSNVVTVTIPQHGLGSGGSHYFDFTSGTGVDNIYAITVVDANTFTIPVTAANSSGDVTLYVRTGMRVNFTGFTPNGTDTYTVSFWVRLINMTLTSGQYAWCDLADGTPSLDYTNQLVQGRWVQIVATGVPTATVKSFFDVLSDVFGNVVLDFWGLKIENYTTGNTFIPIKDTIGGYTFNLYRPQYSTLQDSQITFTRTASTPKHGGCVYTTTASTLASGSFIYSDHTWEIWCSINDVNAGAYDATEGMSILAVYRGYHSGFMYSSQSLIYYLWDNVGPTAVNACTWTLGTSNMQINQNQWYQIVVTRSGNVFTPYVNGTQVGTGQTRAYTALAGVQNELNLGSAANVAAGAGSYVNYSKSSIANMKMYNRALTADEVSQNFNALRGRFGI